MDDDIRVLHVDDPDRGDRVASLLEREDRRLAVETATSPEAGLERLAEEPFDCVVSDYELPGMDGVEFLRAVRRDHPELPFVVFTGSGSEAVASEAISAGVTDYVLREDGTDQYAALADRIRDAVDGRRARAAETEEELVQLAEHTDDVLFMFDGDWSELLFVNSAYEDIWGGSIAELEEDPQAFLDNVHPEDRETARRSMEKIAGGTPDEVEYRVVTDEGDQRWVLGESTPILDDDGEVERIVGFVRDITERKERERARQRMSRRLEALNRATQDLLAAETREEIAEIGVEMAEEIIDLRANAIHLDDGDGALVPVAATDAVHELVDEPPTLTEGDSIAWRIYEQNEPLALDDVRDDPDVYNPETPIQSELLVPIADDGILMAGSSTPAAFDEQDVLLGELLAGNVATALEQVERTEQLRAREAELVRKNERLEAFASVVSHDLRNPLNIAAGRLDLVREECDSDDLDAIEQAHDRMEALIDDLLTLAREGETVASLEAVDLAEVAETCWFTVETADATLAVETDHVVRADANRVRQLFENVFRNAIEHGGDDVTVTVGVLPDGFYVADDGPGIPPAERDRVFDPGYTTGEGTGFGLRIVDEIAGAHGWGVSVGESEEGGARFEFTGVDVAD